MTSATRFEVSDWRGQLDRAHASDRKEPIYRALRPVLDLAARRHLDPATLARLRPDRVIAGRGMPRIARQRLGAGGRSLAGRTLLIQGTGNGWDVASWARLSPSRIVGVDLYPFDSWPEVIAAVRREHGVDVEFHAAPLDDLSFVDDASIDLVASDAVYEHVVDLAPVLAETRRVVKHDGAVYAAYGPLWYCAGGDHFCGRGGLSHVFDHVLLDDDDYRAYFERHRDPVEDFQSGGRYVELDLFSRMRTDDYLRRFDEAGFAREELVLEVSTDAAAFRRAYADRFAELVGRHPQCVPDDFLIKANLIRLRPSSGG